VQKNTNKSKFPYFASGQSILHILRRQFSGYWETASNQGYQGFQWTGSIALSKISNSQ
jgi:hypothetical protein